jgi:hypothetical protein
VDSTLRTYRIVINNPSTVALLGGCGYVFRVDLKDQAPELVGKPIALVGPTGEKIPFCYETTYGNCTTDPTKGDGYIWVALPPGLSVPAQGSLSFMVITGTNGAVDPTKVFPAYIDFSKVTKVKVDKATYLPYFTNAWVYSDSSYTLHGAAVAVAFPDANGVATSFINNKNVTITAVVKWDGAPNYYYPDTLLGFIDPFSYRAGWPAMANYFPNSDSYIGFWLYPIAYAFNPTTNSGWMIAIYDGYPTIWFVTTATVGTTTVPEIILMNWTNVRLVPGHKYVIVANYTYNPATGSTWTIAVANYPGEQATGSPVEPLSGVPLVSGLTLIIDPYAASYSLLYNIYSSGTPAFVLSDASVYQLPPTQYNDLMALSLGLTYTSGATVYETTVPTYLAKTVDTIGTFSGVVYNVTILNSTVGLGQAVSCAVSGGCPTILGITYNSTGIYANLNGTEEQGSVYKLPIDVTFNGAQVAETFNSVPPTQAIPETLQITINLPPYRIRGPWWLPTVLVATIGDTYTATAVGTEITYSTTLATVPLVATLTIVSNAYAYGTGTAVYNNFALGTPEVFTAPPYPLGAEVEATFYNPNVPTVYYYVKMIGTPTALSSINLTNVTLTLERVPVLNGGLELNSTWLGNATWNFLLMKSMPTITSGCSPIYEMRSGFNGGTYAYYDTTYNVFKMIYPLTTVLVADDNAWLKWTFYSDPVNLYEASYVRAGEGNSAWRMYYYVYHYGPVASATSPSTRYLAMVKYDSEAYVTSFQLYQGGATGSLAYNDFGDLSGSALVNTYTQLLPSVLKYIGFSYVDVNPSLTIQSIGTDTRYYYFVFARRVPSVPPTISVVKPDLQSPAIDAPLVYIKKSGIMLKNVTGLPNTTITTDLFNATETLYLSPLGAYSTDAALGAFSNLTNVTTRAVVAPLWDNYTFALINSTKANLTTIIVGEWPYVTAWSDNVTLTIGNTTVLINNITLAANDEGDFIISFTNVTSAMNGRPIFIGLSNPYSPIFNKPLIILANTTKPIDGLLTWRALKGVSDLNGTSIIMVNKGAFSMRVNGPYCVPIPPSLGGLGSC